MLATRKDITAQEIRQWLGLTFLTGLVTQNELKDYWSTNPLHSTPIFPAIMTRNRYYEIKRFIHFNDNSQAPSREDSNHDRLHNISPVLSHLDQNYADLFMPSVNLNVDESLFLFKGRLVWKQCLPL